MATPALRQHGKPKTPKQHFLHLRLDLEALAERYGLELGGPNQQALLTEARRMQVSPSLPRHPGPVVPCRAELDGTGSADPCLIVPADWPIQLLPPHKRLAVGGQVKSIRESRFRLPPAPMETAWRSTQTWQGALMPVLVTIKGDQKYLVRANSWFFRCGEHCGQDIDTSFISEPNERDLEREAYHWGDDMSNSITVVLARFQPV